MSTIKSQHRRECGHVTTEKRGDRFVKIWSYTMSLKEWVRAKLRGPRGALAEPRTGLPSIVEWAIRKGVRT